MVEYVPFSAGVEAKGAAIRSVVAGTGPNATKLLKKYHIDPLTDDQWYSQADYLAILKELDRLGSLDLVSVGMAIPDNAIFPPDIQTVEDILGSLDVAFQMNHRGGDIGEYRFESTGSNSGIMYCRNAYPSDLDFGIIYGLIRKFRPRTSNNAIVVRLDPTKPTRKDGGDSCTFLLSW